jgi:hypothetical protein
MEASIIAFYPNKEDNVLCSCYCAFTSTLFTFYEFFHDNMAQKKMHVCSVRAVIKVEEIILNNQKFYCLNVECIKMLIDVLITSHFPQLLIKELTNKHQPIASISYALNCTDENG